MQDLGLYMHHHLCLKKLGREIVVQLEILHLVLHLCHFFAQIAAFEVKYAVFQGVLAFGFVFVLHPFQEIGHFGHGAGNDEVVADENVFGSVVDGFDVF